MTAIRPRRSVLYMPGSNVRALEKAKMLAADGIIIDLEDAVAPDAKATARDQAVAAVKAGGYGRREVIIRANGLGTPWGEADLKAAASSGADAVLLPKVQSPDDLRAVRRVLSAAGAAPEFALWAMMETPLAMLNAAQIAAAGPAGPFPLAAFVMGTNDLAKETRASLGGGGWECCPGWPPASRPLAPMAWTLWTASITASVTRPVSRKNASRAS